MAANSTERWELDAGGEDRVVQGQERGVQFQDVRFCLVGMSAQLSMMETPQTDGGGAKKR
jgi:hypothetical protein